MLLIFAAMLASGPISKFDDHRVLAEYRTPSKLEDVERCMMDTNMGLPQVVRQPDRPDDVMLLWAANGPYSAATRLRLDLHRASDGGTAIKSWLDYDALAACAPRAG